MNSKYKAVIGLEMHCELKSNSKVFSPSKNSYCEITNSNVNEIDLGFPGILPTANVQCVKNALKMAMILNCEIPKYVVFDRKHYYYPDLPKGYQITQFTQPIGVNGSLKIKEKDKEIVVGIHDIHLEEDAAAMEHKENSSIIDYNRAGVPLLEVVTTPCLHSAQEAVIFLEYMRQIYQYCDISDADTKKGQVRCDVNISICDPKDPKLGTRIEVKNVNSFSNVYDAINYEIKRQSELKDAGRYDEVKQETKRYDEQLARTITMRTKDDAIDYRYFVEPNIPKFEITEEWKQQIKKEIPRLHFERKQKYISEYGLSDEDANILVKEKGISDYFEKCIDLKINPKDACNWINVNVLGYMNKHNLKISDIFLTPEMLAFLLQKLKQQVVSSKQVKEIFFKVLEEKKPPQTFITKENSQISDEKELEKIIVEIIKNNPVQKQQYKDGKFKVFDFFVGQVMKQTKGKANPNVTKQILQKKLSG